MTLIAILAGGRGARAGGEKASMELAGRPLISYPLAAARATGLEVIVVAKRDSILPQVAARIIREPDEPRHPLCGLVAALREAGGSSVLALGCDLPFVSKEVLAWLGSLPDRLAVPRIEGTLQPLTALYGAELTGSLERALPSAPPMQRFVEEQGPRVVTEGELEAFGNPCRMLFNVNTTADLAEAERLLADKSSS
jgi:molybdopterin-guanine dinucleotide biosynthesis protein A